MNIEKLKKLAEAATAGPWKSHKDGVVSAHGVLLAGCSIVGGYIANSRYIAAANPATILELITEIESLRDQVNGLTGSFDVAEKELKDCRANDYTAMGYLADCRIASGDNGKRMLPEFVEYLANMKQQHDELLAALQRIQSTPPAQADGGRFVVDHFDQEGEYIGYQNIDPMWIVQEMVGIAEEAISKSVRQS